MTKVKTPCPICERPMVPRHTKGTDFMPRHNHPSGGVCGGTGAVVNERPRCPDCNHLECGQFPVKKDVCEACGQTVPLDADEVMVKHHDPKRNGYVCDGAADQPMPESPGPAPFDDEGQDCPSCGTWVYGQVCPKDWCGWTVEPVSEVDATVKSVDTQTQPDPFDTPADVAPPEPEVNVSGQPEPLRDQWGRYLLPHPVTGLYSDDKVKATRRNGWMRVTTFAKAAADTYALTRYDERLTLLGATLRPDVIALAHGKDVREDKRELNQLVTQVKDAAGAKVAANIGTAVHGFTEQVDAGWIDLSDVPKAYQEHVERYLDELAQAGLKPVPGLIERTTFVSEWDVVGTFDRVLYHRPSDSYVIGDLKTGRDLSYGRMEIAIQLALYSRGVNAHGVFDWNTQTWLREMHDGRNLRVRTDFGVVMHLPIQGPNAGQCTLKRINLTAGWEAARVSMDVLRSRKRDDYMDEGFELPVAPYAPELPANEPMDWDAQFRLVQSSSEASALWLRAKDAGISGVELNRLVGLAQQRIRELGVSG